MPRPIKALFVAILAPLCVAGAGIVHAQNDSDFQVGDRVEVEKFREWKPGKVIEVNPRLKRIEVLLDEADVPRAVAARMPKEALLRRRRTNVRFEDARHLAGAAKAPATEKPRQWTSKNGKFSIRAKFRGLNGDKVQLEKTNGDRIDVPISSLSDADVQYVRRADQSEESPSEENPFDRAPGSAAASTAGATEPSRKADWKSVKTVRLQSFRKWSFQPNSSKGAVTEKPGPVATLQDIPESDKFLEKVLSLRISADNGRAMVAREKRQPGRGEDERFVQMVNLTQGQCGALVALPPATALLDVHPESGRIMYRPDIFGFGKNIDLTIAQLDGTTLKTIARWRPYGHVDRKPKKDIDRAWFLSADRVMTINKLGDALTIWDVEEARALINVPVASSIRLKTALSPDRTLMVTVMGDGLAIIDLSDGTHRATLPTTDTKKYRSFALRADNQRLAAWSSAGVTVWDLTSGEVVRKLAHPVMANRGNLRWAGEFLLLNDQYLFDTDHRVLLWQFDSPSRRVEAADYQGGRLWFVTDPARDAPTLLASQELPHREAMATVRSLGSPEDLLAVKKGDAVKIEVDIDRTIGSSQEVRQAIEENVKKAGLTVAEDSPLVLTAICKPQEKQTLRINTGDRFRPHPSDIVERTVTPHASHLELKLNGQTVFRRGYIAKPGMTIWLKQGESLDEALTRLTTPNLKLLTHSPIPAELGRPGKANENGAYGVSKLGE